MIEYKVKVYNSGNKEWYINGKFHREDGPAVEYADGDKCWYINGERHREDGPAVECANGSKLWFLNGKRHREDGPAIEYVDGDRYWYVNGKCHREDGPAIEYAWYINDKEYTEQEYLAKTNPVKELTVAEIEKLLGYSVKVIS